MSNYLGELTQSSKKKVESLSGTADRFAEAGAWSRHRGSGDQTSGAGPQSSSGRLQPIIRCQQWHHEQWRLVSSDISEQWRLVKMSLLVTWETLWMMGEGNGINLTTDSETLWQDFLPVWDKWPMNTELKIKLRVISQLLLTLVKFINLKEDAEKWVVCTTIKLCLAQKS